MNYEKGRKDYLQIQLSHKQFADICYLESSLCPSAITVSDHSSITIRHQRLVVLITLNR